MPVAEQLDSVLSERLRKQQEFLLRNYRAELAKDPRSRAAESWLSHLIAMQHTVRQIYGEAVALDVANLVTAPWLLIPASLSVFRTAQEI